MASDEDFGSLVRRWLRHSKIDNMHVERLLAPVGDVTERRDLGAQLWWALGGAFCCRPLGPNQ
eukprot:9059163-Alexandrium_andersonii.AAC.1